MINYEGIETKEAAPDASSMIETFRAVGYDLPTAIADIVDNSISAGAQNIWVDYTWDGPGTQIFITDDGHGMSESELIQAMRPAGRNPLEERDLTDLGRFGLGLKTASLSQCRRFCVVSKRADGDGAFWTWDADYVRQNNAWKLLKFKPEAKDCYRSLEKVDSGTTVIWWDLDRLAEGAVGADETAKKRFLEVMDDSKNHLGMVFHRFIERGLNVYLRDRKIVAWDPFMTGTLGIQTRPEMSMAERQIVAQGFVLPHRSKLTAEQYESGKGPNGSWTDYQGFYIYRNNRLLVAGDWLGLFRKETHYDLCRIKIDITSDFDQEWHIDIKKSQATPPLGYRRKLLALAKEVRAFAVEVYRHRGKITKRTLSKDHFVPVWEERVRHEKRFYRINRKHPIIGKLLDGYDVSTEEVEKALRFIEETVPVPLIMIRENEDAATPHGKPFEGEDHGQMLSVMKEMYLQMIKDGCSREDARARIANTEPFDSYLEYLEGGEILK